MERRPFKLNDPTIFPFFHASSSGILDEKRVAPVLSQIISGPEAVFDFWEANKRVGTAILIDTCTNRDNSAEAILAFNQSLSPDPLNAILDSVEAYWKNGTKTILEIPTGKLSPVPSEVLEKRGYRVAFKMLNMKCKKPVETGCGALPSDFRWVGYENKWLQAYFATLGAALAEIPGTSIPSIDVMGKWCESFPIRPRLLIHNDLVAGYARVEMRENNVGEVTSIGRHPNYRGHRLGEQLLQEALRLLREHWAKQYELEVAGSNESALTLYERFGFVTEHVTTTYRLNRPVS